MHGETMKYMNVYSDYIWYIYKRN